MLHVLYEDNHLLAVIKPPELATMGVTDDEPSLLREAKQYVKHRYNKPGNVYLGVVSRLDAVASGVIVFARTSKAAARLTEQFRSRSVEKTYWAVVEGQPPAADQCVDWLLKSEARQRVEIVPASTPGAREARMRFRRLRTLSNDSSLLEISLETGRKHQIRVQLAGRGFPILGDRKYGSRRPFAAGIALHARRLLFSHPTRGEPIDLTAPCPEAWSKFGSVG
jgi:23S rRNA pseudouridine1911/1915/1917 synthase